LLLLLLFFLLPLLLCLCLSLVEEECSPAVVLCATPGDKRL
jgi:hypothetical protein